MSWFILCVFPLTGSNIQKLTDVRVDEQNTPRTLAEKTSMVRAARQMLSAVTKVLIMADKVVVKQVIASKDKVGLNRITLIFHQS